LFVKERFGTGDLKSIEKAAAFRLMADEWKALSAGEKQVGLFCLDAASL
jgi:hypothetical protein